MEIAHYILFISIVIFLYTWVGYPFVLFLMSRFYPIKDNDIFIEGSQVNSVSIVIAAYNEETNIKERIKNILELKIPDGTNLTLHIGSDGSNDKTIERIKAFNSKQIRIHEFARIGRASVHNSIIKEISDDVIVFTDAETVFQDNFLEKMLDHFKNPDVGIVVGNLEYFESENTTSRGEGIYWRYEKFIRQQEEKCNVLSNATGAAMAIRKNLYKEIRPHEDIDTALPIEVNKSGKKVIYAWDAIAFDRSLEDRTQIFRSKHRGISQTIACWINRLNLSMIFTNPGLIHSFLFHRFFKAASFILIIFIMIMTVLLHLISSSYITITLIFLECSFISIFLIGTLSSYSNKITLKPFEMVFDLVISLSGMSYGLIMGLLNRSPSTYE